MVTFTSRARLIKPAETGEIVDVAQINANSDKVDALLGAVECTSTSRPTDPYPGMIIRETDTGNVYYRRADNLSWVAQGAAHRYQYAPNYVGSIISSSRRTIHHIVLGSDTDQDLLVYGIWYVHINVSTVGTDWFRCFVRSHNSDDSDSTDVAQVNMRPIANEDTLQRVVPFMYSVGGSQTRREISLEIDRNANDVAGDYFNGTGASLALSVVPYNADLDADQIIPGFSLDGA